MNDLPVSIRHSTRVLLSATEHGSFDCLKRIADILPSNTSLFWIVSCDASCLTVSRYPCLAGSIVNEHNLSKIPISELILSGDHVIMFLGTSLGDTIEKKLTSLFRADSIEKCWVIDSPQNIAARFYDLTCNNLVADLPNYILAPTATCKKYLPPELLAASRFASPPELDPMLFNFYPCFHGPKPDNSEMRLLFLGDYAYSDTSLERYSDQPSRSMLSSVYYEHANLLRLLAKRFPRLKLVVRPHPADSSDQYVECLKNANCYYSLDRSPIEESIASASVVVGVNSWLLRAASISSKCCISLLSVSVDKAINKIADHAPSVRLAVSGDDAFSIIESYLSSGFGNHASLSSAQ